MLDLETAQQRILASVSPLEAETVPLAEAEGRWLAEDIPAPIPLPLFDNSGMDGYAVRAADVAEADLSRPVRLRLLGRVAAGEGAAGEVGPGTCVRVFTGSALPDGADAVVMQEETRPQPVGGGGIDVLSPVVCGENIRRRGEDVAPGVGLAGAGKRLTVGGVSLLAAVGLKAVRVGRRPSVGILATGSELREGGEALRRGQIYESNRLGLAVLVKKSGGAPRIYPVVADRLGEVRAALEQAFAENDAVVSSGGASVGELDLVREAFRQLGGRLEFWQVAVKPGKPFLFGRLGAKCLFGLPGNPVSALVTMMLLVRPALARLQGAHDCRLSAMQGRLGEALVNRSGRRHFVRVKVDAAGLVWSAGTQASHALRSLADADGLVEVPAEETLPEGGPVRVLPWG
jgi:molybdopterin molybdotransferase